MLAFTFHPQRSLKLRLFFYLLIFSLSCHAQMEGIDKLDNSPSELSNEAISTLFRQHIQQVDSLSHTAGIANDFARIYTASMKNINIQLKDMDSIAQTFIKKFEISFIGYFLDACVEFEKNGRLSQEAVWNCYFSHPNARPWQLTLIGVNAHINGDIWKGLVKNFSAEEISRYKKNLLSFQTSISKAFQPFFDDLMTQSSYLRFINGFTKGSAKWYGEWLIYNWRLRQIDLAILYFHDKEKFRKKLAIVDRKRHKIDRVILSKGKRARTG